MISIIVWIVTLASLHLAEGDSTPLSYLGSSDEELQHLSEGSVKPVPCGYYDLYRQFKKGCRLSYLTNIFKRKWSNGVITAKQLLKQISSTCSKYASYSKCVNCTARYDCPEESAAFHESLIEEWSVFCEKDQVSDWLSAILQIGYSFNTTLDYEQLAFRECMYQLMESENRYNITAIKLMSLSEGLDYHRIITNKLFKCSVGEILARVYPGTSWQNRILKLWLDITTSVLHGLYINGEEIKMLQETRC